MVVAESRRPAWRSQSFPGDFVCCVVPEKPLGIRPNTWHAVEPALSLAPPAGQQPLQQRRWDP